MGRIALGHSARYTMNKIIQLSHSYLELLTSVEVHIILPAVPGLVLVWEPGVEGDGLLQRVLDNLSHDN